MKVHTSALCFALAAAFGASNGFAQASGLPAEAAARQAADDELSARIDAETVARMAADDALRQGTGEAGLSGRYAVTGTGQCLRSSGGFSPTTEFSPLIAIFAPGSNPPGSNVQPQTFTYSGVRTITATGIHTQSTVYNINHPALVATGGMPGALTGGFLPGGGAVLEAEQDFTYTIDADRTLTIVPQGSHATIVRGGGSGLTVETTGAPPLAGKISKDGKSIVLTNADMAVESTTVGTGQPLERICVRTETMYKIAD